MDTPQTNPKSFLLSIATRQTPSDTDGLIKEVRLAASALAHLNPDSFREQPKDLVVLGEGLSCRCGGDDLFEAVPLSKSREERATVPNYWTNGILEVVHRTTSNGVFVARDGSLRLSGVSGFVSYSAKMTGGEVAWVPVESNVKYSYEDVRFPTRQQLEVAIDALRGAILAELRKLEGSGSGQ